ncbi:hypothetical protein GPROT2_01867 [Gammaproteobacteria bacterium]|nr:hypothetical protein [Gammaproteobacteria bacterium]CAG0942777.1 hypothetical protein GPROT2_01867 [Gammaproteobacteria bacterium]
MEREAPDKHFYAEMRDLNLEFLTLLGHCRHRPPGAPLFGLDAAVLEPLGRLGAAQLEAMAATPCLLAGFRSTPARGLARVAEPPPGDEPGCGGDARVFAAGLLTYVWQMARRDPLRAALCAGPPLEGPAAGLCFRDIPGYASRAMLHIEARFCRHTRFWPDLVRAARDGQPQRMDLVRLTAIQLAVAESGSPRRLAGIAPQARTAAMR